MKLLTTNANESKTTTQVLELLDIVMNIKNEAQYKQRVIRFLYDVVPDTELFEFLSTMIFTAPDEQIQDIGKKKYSKSEHVTNLIENILEKKYDIKLPLLDFLVTLLHS